LGRNLGQAASPIDELNGLVQVGFALCDPLREGERKARLHQDVQAPALHLAALVLFSFKDRQLFHPA